MHFFKPVSVTSCFVVSLILSGNSVGEDNAVENNAVKVAFRTVTSARRLINRQVIARDGVSVGNVADVIVDCHQGRVVMFVVNSRRAANRLESNYFLPAEVVDPDVEKNRLTLTVDFEGVEHASDIVRTTSVTELSDTSVAGIFHHFGVKPFWKSSDNDCQALSLTTIDELDGRIIRDGRWRILARIKEVLIAPHDGWTVAYLGLGELKDHHPTSTRLAVPMSAFARKSISPTWLLDVPADAELLNQTFERGEWPTRISRGWTEFTHVKYGTSPASGLQKIREQAL